MKYKKFEEEEVLSGKELKKEERLRKELKKKEIKKERLREEFKKEEILKLISGWVLFFGIILSLLTFFTSVLIQDPKYSDVKRFMFNWSGLIPTIGILITSIATRRFLIVISEISISLKKINKEVSK